MPATMTLERTRHTNDRVDTLHEMLIRYDEARSESNGAGGTGRHNESRCLGFDPFTWNSSYRELERCLDRLRWLAEHGRPMIERNVSSSTAWWNIRARYLEATVVRREIHTRKTHSGERVPVRLPRNEAVVSRMTVLQGRSSFMYVQRWDARVDPQVVGAALRWISRTYVGTPRVYDESAA